MKKILFLPLILFAGFLVYWGFSLLYCEYLTQRYKNEIPPLPDPSEEFTWIQNVDYFKIINRSDNYMLVYYVGCEKSGGDCAEYEKIDGKWKKAREITVWSSTGSADDYIWPYFYHSPEGILLFVILPVLAIIFIGVPIFIFITLRKTKKVPL